jgi:hypothetical protein
MTMKKHTLQSAILAVALVFVTSVTMTVGHALVAPAAAHAGVIGKIKGAAKTVSKGAAKGIAAAGKGVQTAGKVAVAAGKSVGRDAKGAAVVANKAVFRTPVGKSVARATNVVRRAISR